MVKRSTVKQLFDDEEDSYVEGLDIDEEDMYMHDEENRKIAKSSKKVKVRKDKGEDLTQKLSKYKGKVIQNVQDDLSDDANENDKELSLKDNENEQDDLGVIINKRRLDQDDQEEAITAGATDDATDIREDVIKAKHVVQQQDIYYSIAGLRIILQDILNSANKLPMSQNFEKFAEYNKDEENSPLKALQLLKSNLKETQDNFKALITKIIEKMVKPTLKKPSKRFTQEGSDKLLIKYFKKVISMWYKQTVIQTFRGAKPGAGNKLNLSEEFTSNIDENVESYYDGFRKTTRRFKDKIIGLNLKGRSIEEHDEIFNDAEFYEIVLKDFIQYNSEENGEQTEESGFSSTAMFLQNKREKTKKLINTKASKNRKLRFDKHEKIVNFMIPQENTELFDGRDEFVKKLFGRSIKSTKLEEPISKQSKSIRII